MNESMNLLLSGYITGKSKVIKKKSQQLKIQYFQGSHSSEYLLMEIFDGKHNGKMELYKNGTVYLSWKEENNVRYGDFVVYKQGRAYMEQSWDNYFHDLEYYQILYNKRGQELQIVDTITKNVIYRGEYNANKEKHGYGFVFDNQTGLIQYTGKFKNNTLVYIHQEFDGETMTEYIEDRNSNLDILKRIPNYCGSYVFNEKLNRYVKHGIGYLIDSGTRKAKYEVEYDNDKEVKRVIMSKAGLYAWNTDEDTQPSNHTPVEENAVEYSMVLSSTFHPLESIRLSLHFLSISSFSFNQENDNAIKLVSYPLLEKIVIENQCFCNANSLQIDGLSNLESIVVGDKCFGSHDKLSNSNGVFQLTNCGCLKSVQIGKLSFSTFATCEMRSMIHSRYSK